VEQASKGGKTVIIPCENQYLPSYSLQLIRFTDACRKGVGGKCYLRWMQKMNSKTIRTHNNGDWRRTERIGVGVALPTRDSKK
jgi:hypothetical protein